MFFYQLQIFSSSKDDFSLVLYGTDDTDNSLSEQFGGYSKVVVFDSMSYSLNALKLLSPDSLPIGSTKQSTADCMLNTSLFVFVLKCRF